MSSNEEGTLRILTLEARDLPEDAMLLHSEWFSGSADDGKVEFSMCTVLGAPTLLLTVKKGERTVRATANLSKLTAVWAQALLGEDE